MINNVSSKDEEMLTLVEQHRIQKNTVLSKHCVFKDHIFLVINNYISFIDINNLISESTKLNYLKIQEAIFRGFQNVGSSSRVLPLFSIYSTFAFKAYFLLIILIVLVHQGNIPKLMCFFNSRYCPVDFWCCYCKEKSDLCLSGGLN